MKLKTRDMVLCALFAALVAVGAFIRIPLLAVPFTLQTLFTMLAGLLLGGQLGCLAVLVYIALGLMGLPVFTEGGGIAYVLKPSFGYIIGFAVGAYVTGRIANNVERPGYGRLLAANFAGLAIIYALGMAYYYMICKFYIGEPIGLRELVLYCFLLTIPGDILTCLLGAVLGKRLIPVMQKLRTR